MSHPNWSINQISNNLSRTNLEWSGSTITFGFPLTAPQWSDGREGEGFTPFNGAQKVAARLAVSLIDDVIRPDFRETSGAAQVTFQNTDTNIGYAHAYFPGSGGAAGSAWFNSNYGAGSGTNNLTSPVVGQWGFMTYLHELGHAMGLSHPGNYNGSATYEEDALYRQDTHQYTLMSYFDAENTGADHVASDGRAYYPQTPMLHDIKALQDMYGIETATRAGSTTYGFHANAGRSVYDFTVNKHPVVCIWDGGGNDTLDLSGFASRSNVDLRAGAFSDADGMTDNISIALGAVIENALGGGAGDGITGNNAANLLRGGGGNDKVLGGNGADRLHGDAGNDVLSGGAGADQFVFDRANFGRDRIADFEDGTDRLSFDDTIADAFSNFRIIGNGTESVSLLLGSQSVTLQDDSIIRLTASDFLFV